MIRVNLAVRRQASYLGAGGGETSTTRSGVLAISGKAGSFSALRMFSGENASGALRRIAIPVVLGIVLYFGSDFYMAQETQRMADEKARFEADRSKIQDELKRIKGFESVKSELERNELILKTKIATIEKLIRGREFTLKSMVAMTQALPDDVWISEVTVSDLIYNIRGSTRDIALISDVMNRLGKSIYFKDVTLKNSTSDPGGKFTNFELTARKE
jgi:Tfp pilus assembly protein PilN